MRRLLLGALCLLLLVMPLQPGGATPRQEATEAIDVRLTDLRPVVPDPDKTLRLAGTLVNRTDEPVTAVQVRLLLTSSPVTSRSELQQLADGLLISDGDPTTAVSQALPTMLGGEKAAWSLEIPFAELPLGPQGVYPVAVEAIGTTPDGLTQRLGITRTFLSWFPDPTLYLPTRVVWLWPVTQPPDRALEDVQLTDGTAAAMAPGGRLDTLVRAPGEAPVSWVVDPALTQAAERMTDGYTVLGAETAPTEGPEVAGAWLEELRDATDDSTELLALPYGFPDATALQRAGLHDVLNTTVARAPGLTAEILDREAPEVLGWTPDEWPNAPTLRSMQRSGMGMSLMTDAAAPPEPAVPFTPSGYTETAGVPTVLSDSGLRTALDQAGGSRSETVVARQRLLAELGMITAELPEVQRTVVAAPSPGWSPRPWFTRTALAALQTKSYARLVPLRTLVRAGSDIPRAHLPYGPEQRDRELPGNYMNNLVEQNRQARRFQKILTEPTGPLEEGLQAQAREASGFWRADRATGESLTSLVGEQFAGITDRVRIVSRGLFTLPGANARIPVTVANDLDQPVTVSLRLTTDQPARLLTEPVAPFVVPAGRKISLEVEATVAGSGSLPIRLELTTNAGRPIGDPVIINVRTTAYSRAAGYVVGGAFLVLAVLLALNFVRRRRSQRPEGGEA